MAGKCNFTNNNPLFPPFSFLFLFWIRFKQVHRNQDCFGSKLSRGRGSLVGARKCTNYTLKNLSPGLAATLPCPRAAQQVSLGSQRPPTTKARHLTRVTALPLSLRQLPVREVWPELPSSLPLPPPGPSDLSLMAAPGPIQDDTTLELKKQRVVS